MTRRAARRSGLIVQRSAPFRDPARHLLYKMEEYGAQTLLDVGANTGQFARLARTHGYRGAIVSFEPLAAAHAACAAAAAKDPSWAVMPPLALGSRNGTARINVARNLVSSSLLETHERLVETEWGAGADRTENVAVRTLDDVADPSWGRPLGLKIDTQGFELEILKGAQKTLPGIPVILLEMRLAALYRDAPDFVTLYAALEGFGYRCIGLFPGFADKARQELLELDALFVRA